MGKRNNNLLLSLAFIFAIIFLSSSINAVSNLASNNVTIRVDGVNNNGTMSGSAGNFINVSVDKFYTDQNWTRAFTWIQGSGATANTTLFFINSSGVLNYSGSGTIDNNFTIRLNSSILEDGNDYTITVELKNGSDKVNVTRSSIQIDNTNPSAPTAPLPTSSSNGIVNFSATVTDADTTGCTLNFVGTNPGSSSYTASYSSTSCSFNINSVPEQSYTWFMSATDGKDSTASSTQTTNVDAKTGAGSSMTPQQVKKAEAQKALSLSQGGEILGIPTGWFIGGVIVVGLLYFTVFKKR